MLYLTNSPGLFTSMNDFSVNAKRLSLLEARKLLQTNEFSSAIGHQQTVDFLSKILQIEISYARITVDCKLQDSILAISFKRRLAENEILSVEEMDNFPITFLYYNFFRM